MTSNLSSERYQHAAESDMFYSLQTTRSFVIQGGPRRFLGRTRHFPGSECRRLALGCHVCAVFFSPRPRLGSITVQSQPIVHTGIALLFCFITTTCWAWSLHSCDRYCSFFPINTRSLSHGDPAGRAAVWSGSSGSSMAMNVSKTSSALGRPPGSSSQACTQSASKT